MVASLAAELENVRKGVLSIMGGRVLEYEAKTILNEGRLEQAKETALNLYDMSMAIDLIASAVNVSPDLVKQWLGIATA